MSYAGLGVTTLTAAQKAISPGWPDTTAPPGVQECQRQDLVCRSQATTAAAQQACQQTYEHCFNSDPGAQAAIAASSHPGAGALFLLAVVGVPALAGYMGAHALNSRHPFVWGLCAGGVSFAMMVSALRGMT